MAGDLNYLALMADADPCAVESVATAVAVELTGLIEMTVAVAVAAAAIAVVAVAADS